jgi:hypothetical protein
VLYPILGIRSGRLVVLVQDAQKGTKALGYTRHMYGDVSCLILALWAMGNLQKTLFRLRIC